MVASERFELSTVRLEDAGVLLTRGRIVTALYQLSYAHTRGAISRGQLALLWTTGLEPVTSVCLVHAAGVEPAQPASEASVCSPSARANGRRGRRPTGVLLLRNVVRTACASHA